MTTLGYSVTYRLDDTVNSSIKYLAKYHMLRISRVYIVVDGIDTDGMGWLKEWCACSREMQERKIEEWNATGKRVEVETLAVGGM